MDRKEVIEKVKKFADLVVDQYSPLKIILFGSYANGTYKYDSDIDVAVIVDEIQGDFLDEESKLYKIRRAIDENIEPILLEETRDKSGFLNNILEYGYIIYSK
jgi:uncharacterized protein